MYLKQVKINLKKKKEKNLNYLVELWIPLI